MAHTHLTTPNRIIIRLIANLCVIIRILYLLMTIGWHYFRRSSWFFPVVLIVVFLALVLAGFWVGFLTFALLANDFNLILTGSISGIISSVLTILLLKKYLILAYLYISHRSKQATAFTRLSKNKNISQIC